MCPAPTPGNLDGLVPVLYDELRRVARAQLRRERADHSLQATALFIALDDALNEMGTFDTRQRDIVEMKFFGGLTIDETAAALGVSAATVERDWVLAKAWLYRRLGA